MSEFDVMMVMDTMAQMFETLTARIERTERELDELKQSMQESDDGGK